MKITKKLSSFIALLLFATTFNSHSMQEQPSRGVLGWAAIVGGILLGTIAIKMLWQPQESFPFTDLPQDMQNRIIQLLNLEITAESLEVAAKTINSLAQVNTKLNQKINDSQFCLQLIKYLAQKYDCSDEQAAEMLRTQEAKRRLELQKTLAHLCSKKIYLFDTVKDTERFEKICQEGVDLNFTYKGNITPLELSLFSGNDAFFETLCSVEENPLDGNKRLDRNKRITKGGGTALIIAAKIHKPAYVKILLDTGADPELANFKGITPLQAAQEENNQTIINLIQDAIDKKYEKK